MDLNAVNKDRRELFPRDYRSEIKQDKKTHSGMFDQPRYTPKMYTGAKFWLYLGWAARIIRI